MTNIQLDRLVVLPIGIEAMGTHHHLVGKVVSRAELRNGHPGFWVNVNIGGCHLPQVYLTAELERMPALDVDEAVKHGFCPACLGFGYDAEQLCGTCFGTGRPTMTRFTFDEPGSTEVIVQLDVKTAETFECEHCRKACTPQ